MLWLDSEDGATVLVNIEAHTMLKCRRDWLKELIAAGDFC